MWTEWGVCRSTLFSLYHNYLYMHTKQAKVNHSIHCSFCPVTMVTAKLMTGSVQSTNYMYMYLYISYVSQIIKHKLAVISTWSINNNYTNYNLYTTCTLYIVCTQTFGQCRIRHKYHSVLHYFCGQIANESVMLRQTTINSVYHLVSIIHSVSF